MDETTELLKVILSRLDEVSAGPDVDVVWIPFTVQPAEEDPTRTAGAACP